MNKTIILLILTVFIALFTMSYVSAGQAIETDMDDYDSNYYINGDIPVTNAENKILKDGKSITKNIEINKEVKTYSKTKKLNIECSKKLTKKNIKNGKMGGQYEKNVLKAKTLLKGAKIKSIKIKTTYKKLRDCSGVHNVKIYKATIKYQSAQWKTVTKSTKATITFDKYEGDDLVIIKFTNPFNGKKTSEYGEMSYW